MIELVKTGRSRACARQRVDCGAFEFDGERIAVSQGLLALPCRLLAVLGGCLAVLGCEQAVAGCLRAVLGGPLSLLGGTGD